MVVDNLFFTGPSDTFSSAGTAPLQAGPNEGVDFESAHPSGENVLKKAVIIVAGSAAVILAAAPLALAHGTDHSPSCKSAKQTVGNDLPQTATGVTAPLLGLLGIAANVAAPVTTQAQAPIASCNNIENVLNTKISDNLQDNSKTITRIDRSGNG